jgi:quinoprotein glucose dehydrogenase
MTHSTPRLLLLSIAGLWLGCGAESEIPVGGPATDWRSYGGDVGGMRYAALGDITPENVNRLAVAWTYHTGDLPEDPDRFPSELAFENTPILVDDTLYVCTPYNRVIALDPETGEERWAFDPQVDLSGRYANQLVCRGVSYWRDPQPRGDGAACARRIFMGTADGRLVAIDAETGRPCDDFGDAGQIDLNPAAGKQLWRGEYQVTSPPAIGRDVVIVGSAVSDNARSDAPSGVVRAFDARSGALRWAWDLSPPGFVATPENTSDAGYALATPNVWAPMSVDVERDLLFVPTGNPAPDFYRGADSQMDYYGSSVVALNASTGEVVWNFQTVHHDLWDYDVPAQPTLFDLVRDGREIPAVVQATKMGMLFFFHRETGEPLFPIEERPVPASDVPGERASPTQPFPTRPAPLVRQRLSAEDAWGLTPWDRGACREAIAALRNEGIYTPPGLQPTLMYPGSAGGSNWGGVAIDPERQLLVANTGDYPWLEELIPRAQYEERKRGSNDEFAPQTGTPFGHRRSRVMSPLGVPCNAPPWGQLAVVDLASGDLRWQVPLGTLRDIAPIPLTFRWGIPGMGGPIVTEGGLVFIGAALEKTFRAFDLASGEELWSHRLPAGAQATPLSYRVGGRQFVVVAAGGYGRAPGVGISDAVVAFALR